MGGWSPFFKTLLPKGPKPLFPTLVVGGNCQDTLISFEWYVPKKTQFLTNKPPNLTKPPPLKSLTKKPPFLTKKNPNLTQKIPMFLPQKTQKSHFLPKKKPKPQQESPCTTQTFGRPYDTPKEDSCKKKTNPYQNSPIPNQKTPKPYQIPPVFLSKKNTHSFPKKNPKPPQPLPIFFLPKPPLKSPISYLKKTPNLTKKAFAPPCHTLHPYISAQQTQSIKMRKGRPYRSNRLSTCCCMDVGICTPADPLFSRHLVYPYSLGCTTQICHVKTGALNLKQAEIHIHIPNSRCHSKA